MQWFLYVNAALTPLIAIFMGYIAYQQFQVNRRRLNHELYERRLSVFKATMTFIEEILVNGAPDRKSLAQFYRDTSEVDFLFEKEIQEHIKELYDLGHRLIYIKNELHSEGGHSGLPKGPQRTQMANEDNEIMTKFIEELTDTKELFAKYLKIK